MKPKHTGTVTGGKLKLDNRDFFTWDIGNYEGQDVELIIKGVRATRSNKMNRYYWGVVVDSLVAFFRQEGTFEECNREFVHDLLKAKFLGSKRVFLADGQGVDVVNSSARLDNREFVDYLERITRWAASFLLLEIPEPNECIEK